jgi:hypothetical protein
MSKQPVHGVFVHWLPCECGQRGYRDRASAKRVIKELRRKGVPDPMLLTAWQCDADPDFWHVGRRTETTEGT